MNYYHAFLHIFCMHFFKIKSWAIVGRSVFLVGLCMSHFDTLVRTLQRVGIMLVYSS